MRWRRRRLRRQRLSPAHRAWLREAHVRRLALDPDSRCVGSRAWWALHDAVRA